MRAPRGSGPPPGVRDSEACVDSGSRDWLQGGRNHVRRLSGIRTSTLRHLPDVRARRPVAHMPDMDITDDRPESEGPLRVLLAIALVGTMVGRALDLHLEAPASWPWAHVPYGVRLIAA